MSTPPSKPFEVAIVGGGIAGVALAVGLKHRNISCHIYERGGSFAETSAGVAIQGNGARALQALHPGLRGVFDALATPPADRHSMFTVLDGFHASATATARIPWDGVASGVHRSQLLDGMAALLPPGAASFGKKLDDIEEDVARADGKLRLRFADGTAALADVVVGCDGLGSRVRRCVVGEGHPAVRAGYAHRYVYRTTVPMAKAAEIMGEEQAKKQTFFLGKHGYVIMFPIAKGALVSFQGVRSNPDAWSDEHRLTVPTTREAVEREFGDFMPRVRALLACLDGDGVDKWGLFDLRDNEPDTYSRGRVCIAGDAAHATTPHLGSGVNYALEDAAMLARLLGDARVESRTEVASALAAYDGARRPAGRLLMRASREIGSMLCFEDEEVGCDMEKLEVKLVENWTRVTGSDPEKNGEAASERLGELLSAGV